MVIPGQQLSKGAKRGTVEDNYLSHQGHHGKDTSGRARSERNSHMGHVPTRLQNSLLCAKASGHASLQLIESRVASATAVHSSFLIVFSWPPGAPHHTGISFLELSWQSPTNQATEEEFRVKVLAGQCSIHPSAPFSPRPAFVVFGILWSIRA